MISTLVVSFIAALTISGTAIHFLLPETILSADDSFTDAEFISPLADTDTLGTTTVNAESSPTSSPDEQPTSPLPTPSKSPSQRSSYFPTTLAAVSPRVSPRPIITPLSTSHPTPTATSTPRVTPVITPRPTATPLPKSSPVTSAQLDEWFGVYAAKESVSKDLLRKIALCESRYNQLAKNGDYGGLYQFSTGTWVTTRRAMNQNPDPLLRFSAEEAIKTAAFRLATRGPASWPNCSK